MSDYDAVREKFGLEANEFLFEAADTKEIFNGTDEQAENESDTIGVESRKLPAEEALKLPAETEIYDFDGE